MSGRVPVVLTQPGVGGVLLGQLGHVHLQLRHLGGEVALQLFYTRTREGTFLLDGAGAGGFVGTLTGHAGGLGRGETRQAGL